MCSCSDCLLGVAFRTRLTVACCQNISALSAHACLVRLGGMPPDSCHQARSSMPASIHHLRAVPRMHTFHAYGLVPKSSQHYMLKDLQLCIKKKKRSFHTLHPWLSMQLMREANLHHFVSRCGRILMFLCIWGWPGQFLIVISQLADCCQTPPWLRHMHVLDLLVVWLRLWRRCVGPGR